MRIRVIVFPIVLVVSHIASHAQGKNFDGELWAGLDKISKYSWINGYHQGLSTASTAAPVLFCNTAKSVQDCYAEASEKVDRVIMGSLRGTSIDQLSDGIDTFYADYRNRRIQIQYAVGHVSRSIKGASAAALEKEAEALRREAGR